MPSEYAHLHAYYLNLDDELMRRGRRHAADTDRTITQLIEARSHCALAANGRGQPPFMLHVVTHPRIFDRRHAALEALFGLLASPSLRVFNPGSRYPKILLRQIG